MKRDSNGRTLAQWRKAVREACSEARLNKRPAVLHLLPEKHQTAEVRYNAFAHVGRYYGVYYLMTNGVDLQLGKQTSFGVPAGEYIKHRAPVWATSEEMFLQRLMQWCVREGISVPALPATRRGNHDV